MAKEKNVSETTGSVLYRVNYIYLTEGNEIRPGALVIEAKTPEEAKEVAGESLKTSGKRHPKINNVKVY